MTTATPAATPATTVAVNVAAERSAAQSINLTAAELPGWQVSSNASSASGQFSRGEAVGLCRSPGVSVEAGLIQTLDTRAQAAATKR